VGLAQIRRLEELTVDRIAVAEALTEGLRGIPGIVPPHVDPRARHVYYAYVMKVKAAQLRLSRAQLAAALNADGLAVQEGYVRPIYLYPMYDRRVGAQRTGMGAGLWHPPEGSPVRYQRGLCPVTERMHFEEALITSIFRTQMTVAHAQEFLGGLERILAHREAVRQHLGERGIN
jgi:perosamine synthetase